MGVKEGNRFRWTVDARRLKSKYHLAVSPPFEIQLGREVSIIMKIRSKRVHESKGGASFKKAKGKGSVELRCLGKVDPGEDLTATCLITVSSGLSIGERRGPVNHNFADRAICGLAEAEEEEALDFSKHVNTETNTFEVVLEILAAGAAA